MIIKRRSFLIGALSTIAAPAIAKSATLMPLRGIVMPVYHYRALCAYHITTDSWTLRLDKAQFKLYEPEMDKWRQTLVEVPESIKSRLIDKYDEIIGYVAPTVQCHINHMLESMSYKPSEDWSKVVL